MLPTRLLKKIVDVLKKNNLWCNPAEATIEVNPGTADLEKLSFFRGLGFDRISFGIQSLNDVELQAVGRIHTAQEALEAIKLARLAGFERVSADLIYGLPCQTPETLRNNLQTLDEMGVEHLSVYGLTVEEKTPLAHLLKEKKIILPDEDQQFEMYELVQAYLTARGLRRYEISNYAKQGQESLHNLGYWRYLPYQSFGSAACSFDGEKRFVATASVTEYIESIKNGVVKGETEMLDESTQLAEYLFMGLRTATGIDTQETKKRFGCDVMTKFAQDLPKFIEKKLLNYKYDEKRLRLTEMGMRFSNEIFEIFVK